MFDKVGDVLIGKGECTDTAEMIQFLKYLIICKFFFWKAYNILINIWNSKSMICCAEASEKKDKKYPPRYEGVNIKCFFQAYFQNPMPNYQ